MKKIKLSVAALLIASASFSQTQCKGLTKDSVQCKNTVKAGELCYLHNPNYVKSIDCETLVCSGTTKSNKNCKNKTKNCDGLCYLHTKND
tara:strand:- start:223 stop:492 length:270 start_codon:yes stop_codon:yes gene_type:complete